VSEGYDGVTTATGGGTGTTSEHAVIPFLGHVLRVSGLLREQLRARRAVPYGWMRHA